MYIGYIYQTTNLVNQRIYIGKKHSTKFDNSYYGSGVILREAIKKHGAKNFKIEVLYWATTVEDLNQKEIEYINIYSNKNLYNIAKGGFGGDTTSNHPNKDIIVNRRAVGLKSWHNSLTQEQKTKRNASISKSKKGIVPNRINYSHSTETINKIKESNKISAKNRSDIWKLNHAVAAEKRKGVPNIKSYKSVEILGIIYESFKEASLKLNVSRATINNWVKKGKGKIIC